MISYFDPISIPEGKTLEEIKMQIVLSVLQKNNYNRTHTARALGIGIRTLQRRLKKLGGGNFGNQPSH